MCHELGDSNGRLIKPMLPNKPRVFGAEEKDHQRPQPSSQNSSPARGRGRIDKPIRETMGPSLAFAALQHRCHKPH